MLLLSMPDEILEKIIYKPLINKQCQTMSNNIFINTTKNVEIIKLGICKYLIDKYYDIINYENMYKNQDDEIIEYNSINEMYDTEIKRLF